MRAWILKSVSEGQWTSGEGHRHYFDFESFQTEVMEAESLKYHLVI